MGLSGERNVECSMIRWKYFFSSCSCSLGLGNIKPSHTYAQHKPTNHRAELFIRCAVAP